MIFWDFNSDNLSFNTIGFTYQIDGGPTLMISADYLVEGAKDEHCGLFFTKHIFIHFVVAVPDPTH